MDIFRALGSLVIPHFVALDLKSDSLGSQISLVIVFNFKGLTKFWSSKTIETASLKLASAIFYQIFIYHQIIALQKL